jgi:hypothetical protein
MVDVDFELDGIETLGATLEETADDWRGEGGYRVSSSVEYAFFQEYGTRYQSGKPHVRPGADQTRARLGQIALQSDGVDEFLRKSALFMQRSIRREAPVDTGKLRDSYTLSRL